MIKGDDILTGSRRAGEPCQGGPAVRSGVPAGPSVLATGRGRPVQDRKERAPMLGIHRTPAICFRHRAARTSSARRRADHRPLRAWTVESLEGRALLSTWPVTTLADSGDGSL